MNAPWDRTTHYGRAALGLHPLVREAYKVGCLIELCGASIELTAASTAAFSLCESLSDSFKELLADRDQLQISYAQEVAKSADLTARLARAERDAARYRWLRDHHQTEGLHRYRLTWYLPRNLPLNGDGLDANIDAETASATSGASARLCENCGKPDSEHVNSTDDLKPICP